MSERMTDERFLEIEEMVRTIREPSDTGGWLFEPFEELKAERSRYEALAADETRPKYSVCNKHPYLTATSALGASLSCPACNYEALVAGLRGLDRYTNHDDATWVYGDDLDALLTDPPESPWRPIKTAPKERLPNGSPNVILLSLPPDGTLKMEDERRVYEGCWSSTQQRWTSVNGFILLDTATHWMPLPAPLDRPPVEQEAP